MRVVICPDCKNLIELCDCVGCADTELPQFERIVRSTPKMTVSVDLTRSDAQRVKSRRINAQRKVKNAL